MGRKRELALLEKIWASDKAELFILYGRRRIGKTALLRHFCRHKDHVYFLAAQVKEEDNLRQFKEVLQLSLADPILDNIVFPGWEDAFAYLGRVAKERRLVVVLDEFQYLCEANPALPSLLQRFWDLSGAESRLMLILCGSYVSFMEREVLGEKSPLFGRRTSQLQLQPLPFFEATAFFPAYPLEDRLAVYGILGGTPAYLRQFDPAVDLAANLRERLLSVEAYLYDEANLLLRMELSQIHVYASLLKAIAGGATKLNEIAGRAGLDSPAAGKYLNTLRELGLVERQVSFLARAPEKSRKGRYYIRDPYLRFWFRFVLPHASLIQVGEGDVVYSRFIAPYFPTYMGLIFEDICREALHYAGPALVGDHVQASGKHWERDFDLDVTARLADGHYLFGECKWSKEPVGLSVLAELLRKVEMLPAAYQEQSRLAIFALNGFQSDLRAAAASRKVALVSGRDLLVGADLRT
ncbi:MAG: ATP-binding protein [Firmicutes bacterium]|nr:ATP-binding protein [Bacillota bacterium]